MHYRRVDDFISTHPRSGPLDDRCAGAVRGVSGGKVPATIGTGVADDKSIYPFVPDMIRFYLTEEPILNNVPTWQLRKTDELSYCLEHLHELVVKVWRRLWHVGRPAHRRRA